MHPSPPPGKEVASLEALLRARDALHRRRLDEGAAKAAALERQARTLAAQNAQVAVHLEGLRQLLAEQARLADAADAAREEPHERWVRGAAVCGGLRQLAGCGACWPAWGACP